MFSAFVKSPTRYPIGFIALSLNINKVTSSGSST